MTQFLNCCDRAPLGFNGLGFVPDPCPYILWSSLWSSLPKPSLKLVNITLY